LIDDRGSSRYGEVLVRRWTALTLLAGIALLSAGRAAAAGEGRVAACAPRAHNDPGRLNVAVDIEGYGIMAPCRADLVFHIAKNTPLRSIEATIRVSTAEGGD